MPSFVNPEPMVGIAADEGLQDPVEVLSIELSVALAVSGANEGDGGIEV